MRVLEIRRHPVKGLGAELFDSADLVAGRALPGDRTFALATAKGAADALAAEGAWVRCRNFVRPTTDPRLAQVQVMYDDQTGWLIARHPKLAKLTVDLSAETGGPALCDWVAPLVSPGVLPLTLVRAAPERVGAAAHYADVDLPAISIMSTASLADLSKAAGQELQRDRFRGALWLEGGAPWAEAEWVGRKIKVGGAVLEIVGGIERCASPGANPETGERDVPVVELLERLTGAREFGVLARVVESGRVSARDPVEML